MAFYNKHLSTSKRSLFAVGELSIVDVALRSFRACVMREIFSPERADYSRSLRGKSEISARLRGTNRESGAINYTPRLSICRGL